MIKDKTIEEIKDLNLVDVISKYVDLKKSGANWIGKSPFSDEKTGSFVVSPSKNIWKCFSSSVGGNDGISFLMKAKQMSFTDAVRAIASDFAISVEFDNSDESKVNVLKQEKRTSIADINALALDYFQNNLEQLDESKWRVNKETAEQFSIGYALNDWKGLYQFLIGKGVSENMIFESELCGKSEKGTIYDFFRNRIVFPLYNRQLQIVGFSGRALSPDEKAKYINSRETVLFNKSKAFLGMDQARPNIVKSSSATIVEGNFDVTAMHNAGFKNTVAACGTAFTISHAQELKKLKVNSLLFVYDGDTPGLKALNQAIVLAISENFTVQCAILPEGIDPDDYFKTWEPDKEEKKNTFLESIQDGVEFYANELFKDANTTVRRSTAEAKLEDFLSTVKDTKLRKNYVKTLAKTHGFAIAEAEKGIKAKIVERNKEAEGDNDDSKWRFPPYLSSEAKKEFDVHGFYEDETPNKIGYWFASQGHSFEQVSNFLVRPLFHIVSFYNNRRLIEIQNKHGKHIIEVPSKGFVSVAPFQEECMNNGNFQLFGSTKQFRYISNKFLDKMPKSHEITTPGQQKSGFWAYANGIIENDIFREVDDYGIVRSNIDDTHYFLPAFSSIYKDFQEVDDPYESDRQFVFRKSEVNFKSWSSMYNKVHGDNGMFAISFLCAALFRDFIQSRSTFFPILYNFGDVQTGKSTAAAHISAVLLGSQSPVMLNAVTKAAMSRKLAQFRNGIIWADEYRNDIHEDIFQNLKAVWDGAARDKGKMTNDNKTTSTKIESALQVSGQYLPTRDSNALFTRMIICTFDIKAEDRTQQNIDDFQQLIALNRKGLSGVVMEIIKWRDHVKANYENEYQTIMKEMKLKLVAKEYEYNGRVLQNYCVVLAIMRVLQEKVQFPFTYSKFEKVAVEMVAEQSSQISESDVLNSYWKMIEFLFFNYDIEYGKDFAVKEEVSVSRYLDKKKTERFQFEQKKKVLYIQFGRIHPKYMEKHKAQNGTVGTNEGSIQSYMKSNKAFIGVCPAFSFEDKRTTAWMFDYDMLGISLERTGSHSVAEVEEDTQKRVEKKPEGIQTEITPDNDLPF